MPKIGYHPPPELVAPRELLGCVQAADHEGFSLGACSSAFTWPWLGAVLGATDLPFGVTVTSGTANDAATLAAPAATLSQIYPGRLWLAFGGKVREPKALAAALRAAWSGETGEGGLNSRPGNPPPLLSAAHDADAARNAGSWADGLFAVTRADCGHEAVIRAFREGGGEGKSVFLLVRLSWAESEEEAKRNAHAAGAEGARVSSDFSQHLEWLAEDAALGCSALYLWNVGPNQHDFIHCFGRKVLPAIAPV